MEGGIGGVEATGFGMAGTDGGLGTEGMAATLGGLGTEGTAATLGGFGMEGAELAEGTATLGACGTAATDGGLGIAETEGLGTEGTAEGFKPGGGGGTTALFT
jgi:hypothetical protein